MRKLTIFLFLISTLQLSAQKYVTKSGEISFYSETPMEKIEAVNKNVMAAYDASKQVVVVKVLLKSFRFEKALMEEHFNENYVESDDYPNSTFKGKLVDLPDASSKEIQTLRVKGKLKIHGVERDMSTSIKFQFIDNNIVVKGSFNIKIEDYNIDIPSAVIEKIAKNLEVTYNFNLKAM